MGFFGELAHVGAIVIGALRNACRQQSKNGRQQSLKSNVGNAVS